MVQSTGGQQKGSTYDSIQGSSMGFPWLSNKHQKDALLGNTLIHFMIKVLELLEQHPYASTGHLVLVFGEHPEDLGAIWREEDGMKMQPASIWQLPSLRQSTVADNKLGLYTVVFNQCCWSAPYRKPTRLLANLTALRSWGPNEWPSFHADGSYAGPATKLCQCHPTVSLARAHDDPDFRTTATSIYPEPMDRAIAQAIWQDLQAQGAPSSAKEGVQRKRALETRDMEEPRPKKLTRMEADAEVGGATLSKSNNRALNKSNNSAVSKLNDGALSKSSNSALSKSSNSALSRLSNSALSKSSNSALSKLSNGASSKSNNRALGSCDSSALSNIGGGRPGVGPPMQTKYKGDLRPLHDGAGLCSPGRWPVGRRTAPAEERGRELSRWCLKAFEDWVELEGEEKAKKIVWSMAAGRLDGTPFGRSLVFESGWTCG